MKCHIQEKDPDIIAVTEILPKTSAFYINTSYYYSIDGYTQFTSDLTYGRGCVLYIKSNIPVSYTNFNNTFQESVWCSINLIGSDKLLIGCVYRNPNSNAENNQELLDLFLKVKDLNPSHVLIMGDFNLREIHWKMNTSRTNETHFASQFLECVRGCFFYQQVKDFIGILAMSPLHCLIIVF